MIKYLVILLSFCLAADNDEGSISGTVMGDEVPLFGANVFLEGTTLGTTTDSLGNYVITRVPVGKYLIRADFLIFISTSRGCLSKSNCRYLQV